MNAPFRRAGDIALRWGPGALIIPPGFRYLLLMRRDETNGRPLKPAAFHDLGDMARHIHRLRRDPAGPAALQLLDSPILAHGEDTVRHGVSIWRLARPIEDGRRRYLGWAWIDGAGQVTLQAALRRAEQWERIA